MSADFGQLNKAFADQFEPYEGAFLYRRSSKGAAIRVTADERERFVAEFDRQIKRSRWLIYGGVALLIFSAIVIPETFGIGTSNFIILIGVGVILGAFMLLNQRAWNEPEKYLSGRAHLFDERSPREMRKVALEKLTYGELVAVAVSSFILLAQVKWSGDLASGWNLVCLVGTALLLLVAAMQAFRKWRLDAGRIR